MRVIDRHNITSLARSSVRFDISAVSLCCLLWSGCSAHASFRAGSYTVAGAEPSSSAPHRHASPDEGRSAERSNDAAPRPANPSAAPAPAEQPALVAEAPPPNHPAPQEPQARADRDHDRGHGNDADRHDEDNPGKSGRGKHSGVGAQGDHDRGHGNDADRHDEENPGKGKGKKK